MENLKQKFKNYKSFEECSKDLAEKKLEQEALNILKNFDLDTIIRTRVFITCFVFYYFPVSFEDEKEETKDVMAIAREIVEHFDVNGRQKIIDFTIAFEKWREKDMTQFKADLIDHYHGLSVELMNVDDPEAVEHIKKTRETVLECARQIGFEKELLNYIPVIFNTSQFMDQCEKAFVDLMTEELKEKKFDRVKEALVFFQSFFLLFYPNSRKEEIRNNIDIDFIEQQYQNDVYEDKDYRGLINYMYGLLKGVQSRARDEFLEEKMGELDKDVYVNVPSHVLNLYQGIEYFIQDMYNVQNTLK